MARPSQLLNPKKERKNVQKKRSFGNRNEDRKREHETIATCILLEGRLFIVCTAFTVTVVERSTAVAEGRAALEVDPTVRQSMTV
jgi:hypothetical protein